MNGFVPHCTYPPRKIIAKMVSWKWAGPDRSVPARLAPDISLILSWWPASVTLVTMWENIVEMPRAPGGFHVVEEQMFEQENKGVVVCLETNRVKRKRGGLEQREDESGT